MPSVTSHTAEGKQKRTVVWRGEIQDTRHERVGIIAIGETPLFALILHTKPRCTEPAALPLALTAKPYPPPQRPSPEPVLDARL